MLSDVKDETLNCMISEKRVFIRHRAALCRTLFLGGFWWPHDPTYDMGPAQGYSDMVGTACFMAENTFHM